MIQKRFNLNEVLDSMPNPPRTLTASQFKRMIGDVVTTYQAKFEVVHQLNKIGEAIAEILSELRIRDIQSKKFEVVWAHDDNHKVFSSDDQLTEFTLVVELITPDVRAREKADDERSLADVQAFVAEQRQKRNAPKTVDAEIIVGGEQ